MRALIPTRVALLSLALAAIAALPSSAAADAPEWGMRRAARPQVLPRGVYAIEPSLGVIRRPPIDLLRWTFRQDPELVGSLLFGAGVGRNVEVGALVVDTTLAPDPRYEGSSAYVRANLLHRGSFELALGALVRAQWLLDHYEAVVGLNVPLRLHISDAAAIDFGLFLRIFPSDGTLLWHFPLDVTVQATDTIFFGAGFDYLHSRGDGLFGARLFGGYTFGQGRPVADLALVFGFPELIGQPLLQRSYEVFTVTTTASIYLGR